MAKNILQDIVPPEKRSIRNIPLKARPGVELPSSRSAYTPKPIAEKPFNAPVYESEESSEDNSFESSPKVFSYGGDPMDSDPRYSKKAIWTACGVALVIVVIALSTLISSGATVHITPKTTTLQTNGTTFHAYQTTGTDGVPYEIVKITKDVGSVVTATGEQQVSDKASGTIVIYNNAGKASQRLIKNTRFQTPEGLIFRINDSVVVPGQVVSGGKITPGSVEVIVYADEAGDKYNVGLKDFTIPGFKGDPRFQTIYARSKTEMAGGFVGTRKQVAQPDLDKAQTALKAQIDAALKKEVLSQIPADYIAYPDGMIITYNSLPQSNAQGTSVQINERGTMSAIIFNKSKFSSYIAENLAPEFASSSTLIANSEDISFTIQNKVQFDPTKDTDFTFTLGGPVKFVSQYNSAKLSADLAGKSKGALQNILARYPEIEKADVVLRPFWKQSFPTKVKDIHIVTQTNTNK